MNLITEYLVIIEKKASEALFHLCDSVSEFKKLLHTDPDIRISKKSCRFKQEFEYGIEIVGGDVEGKEQRFFFVRIIFTGEENEIDEYSKALRAIRGVINRSGGQPETLWDDVSGYYSQKAYPLIHQIENLMRKLIAYFMLTTVGKEWVSLASPKAIQDAIDKSKRKQYLDILHQTDFIHLGDLLFKSYQTREISELYEILEKARSLADFNFDELQAFVRKSNWERYFAKIVDCTDEFLNKRWTELYDLRCKVAHNALISKTDYERIETLVNDLKKYIQRAIDNLDKVRVPEQDVELVAENVISSINALFGEFIQRWKSFETVLESLKNQLTSDDRQHLKHSSPITMLKLLRVKELIDESIYEEGRDLIQFRNRIVHGPGVSINEEEILLAMLRLDKCTNAVQAILQKSWKEEVATALKSLGGEANLQDIYDYVGANTARKMPQNWEAAIRWTLQSYSSDTSVYKGGDDIFRHVDRGRWGLRGEESNSG